ncbi:MAG TPA: hypothetical protein VLD67_05440 [Vicinamibacterales bacterium]|nr:hypothetical protein [Vicinamibacterales bacterium]
MKHSTDEQKSAVATDAVSVQETALAASGETAGVASLDKVRDILFGSQMRDVERRFARLEERLVRETNELKEDVRKRLEALEAYARQETETLAGRIRTEHDDRVEGDSGLSSELKETARSFERRAASIDEQLAKAQREVRQQMLEQHQRLSDDTRQKMEEVLAALAREANELRSDKADRRVIASLLTEMAMRLTNELRIPGAEDLGNG